MVDNYNTRRSPILLKEYGRNIQKIADYILSLEDLEKQKRMALSMVKLMKQVNPGLKDSQEYEQKVWNDFYLITDYQINIDHPFLDVPVKPEPDAKPRKVPYASNKIKLKHFGKNLESLVHQIEKIEDEEEKEKASIYLARIMKRFYQAWNKETLEDAAVIKQLHNLSAGKIKLDLDMIKEGNFLQMSLPRESSSPRSSNPRSNNGRRPSNNNNNNNNARRKRKKF